jgi:hypothetical protein
LLLALLLLELLELEGGWSAEVEDDGVGGQLAVGMSEGLKALFDDFFIKGIKEDLLSASSVNGKTNLTASDA